MISRRVIAAAVALTASTLAVSAPAALAADGTATCTPSITMPKPFQDPTGWVVMPANYSVCTTTLVKIKSRMVGGPPGWGGDAVSFPAGSSGTRYAAVCYPDGKLHKWVAYATLKTPQGVLIAKSAKVWIKSKPVTYNCEPWSPPAS
jgi:hypothetical protein